MIHVTCNTIEETISAAMKITIDWGDGISDLTEDVWYRGSTDCNDLLPSAYRKDVDELSATISFTQMVRSITDTRDFNAWDYYCLARHHVIPTRLLDWTEGFIQALFFAFDGWDGMTKPCIWMLRPHLLNKESINDDCIIAPWGTRNLSERAVDMWLPPIETKTATVKGIVWSNKHPLAIYPSRSNPRVIGQLGTFTVHGFDKTSLNEFIQSRPNSDLIMARIDLVGFDPQETQRKLWYLGLRQSVIYPDPDHIVKDIRYSHNW